MDLKVINEQGQSASTLSASDALFAREFNESLVHQIVVAYQANARLGTRAQKGRSDVNRSGKKPWRQKGTGRARQGSIRTPLRPGGGVVFGPKPRTYNLAMNRKERRLALRTALMSRAADITVVKGFGAGLDTPKTKEITAALSRFGIADGAKVLVVLDAPTEVVIELTEGHEKVAISKDKPLSRVMGYACDLRHDLERKDFTARRVDDTINLDGVAYKIVAITKDEVVISDPTSQKRTVVRSASTL